MNKIAFLVASALLAGSSAVVAQSEMDAYRYSQSGLTGTARYLGMAGAFGALGGDISAMSANPAGLGIYRSSEIVTSLSLSSVNTKTNWLGDQQKGNRTKLNFDNIAYVGYFPTSNDEGIVSWNVGVSYNRAMNYSRNYTMTGKPQNSLSAYIADKTAGLQLHQLQLIDGEYDPYDNLPGDWMSVLGFEAGLITPWTDNPKEESYRSLFGKEVGNDFERYSPDRATLNVRENGAIDLYNFSFATNISNRVFLGATFAVTDMSYNMYSFYDESFGSDYMNLENRLKTNGTGYSFNFGAIYRPADFLRLGVAYNSATWYKMTDYFNAKATSFFAPAEDTRPLTASTPDNNPYYNYQIRTPDKWIFSAAAFFGQYALLSVDYEMKNYKGMRMSSESGVESADNELIKTDFGMANLLKVGAEVKVTPQFSVRAGAAWETNPAKSQLHAGTESVDVFTVGTIPNYLVNNGTTSYYTAGLGYRFTRSFYADLAYVFKGMKDEVFAFANTYDEGKQIIQSAPATMKTNTNRVALTLGYKF